MSFIFDFDDTGISTLFGSLYSPHPGDTVGVNGDTMSI